jgi:hypothetical protein
MEALNYTVSTHMLLQASGPHAEIQQYGMSVQSELRKPVLMNLSVGSRHQIHSAGVDAGLEAVVQAVGLAEAEVVVLDASIYPFIGSKYQLNKGCATDLFSGMLNYQMCCWA